MDFLSWGRNPWGQDILTHVSWDLLWASLFAGLAFLVAHASYMILSAHRKSSDAEVDVLEAKHRDIPERVQRHSLVARLFHWVMAASMFALLFTAFLPIAGVKFAWVRWHWMAGLVLTGSIIFHILHATFAMDFWSIWIGPKDLPDLKAELLHDLIGQQAPRKAAKYPLGNRLYHLALVVVGLGVIATGVLMMNRVRTPVFVRNPYLYNDIAWGFTYVLHGMAGVGLIGLVIAHIYFAIRPEKLWITKSMFLGYITRRDYLANHDPKRWVLK
jgi:cytochrome b subunit of formate dehydrogenase